MNQWNCVRWAAFKRSDAILWHAKRCIIRYFLYFIRSSSLIFYIFIFVFNLFSLLRHSFIFKFNLSSFPLYIVRFYSIFDHLYGDLTCSVHTVNNFHCSVIIKRMYVFVSEDHMLDWHPCQICYPLEIKLLLLSLFIFIVYVSFLFYIRSFVFNN